MAAIPLKREVEYPSSDGKPMAETDLHREEMMYVIGALGAHFRAEPDVYVSGNLLLYFVEGDPTRSVSPDALVTRGLPHAKELRDTYKVWEEGQAPSWVIEVTSKTTRLEDLNRKKSLYERLGVEEYFLFDPRAEYLDPPLQGFRLAAGRYEPIALESDGSLVSRGLGIVFRREGERLRMIDARTGRMLPRTEEVLRERQEQEERANREAEARRAAEERAAQEAEARRALEAEVARLRAELERGRVS
jgi:Uma2 family endonuclease